MSRRAVLVAGFGGLAVGAGGTEIGRALAETGPAAESHLASPGEELMTEHGVLKRLLLAYRAIHDRLAAGESVAAGVVTDSAGLIADYVESFHEGLEEAYVFPRVAAEQPALIRTLLVQHDHGRHLTAAIQAAASAGLSEATVRAALASDIAAFVRMYEPREAWEDTVVYPALRAVTAQRTLDELAGRFAELENRQYGDSALTAILQRVAGVEDELGIGDIAAFTPSGVA
jgi:hemerythrin-like domain-containing protein